LLLVALLAGLGCGHRLGEGAVPSADAAQPVQAEPAPPITLPNRSGSLKFAVLGDLGVGSRPAYERTDQMARRLSRFELDLVGLVGDTLYGSERPQDFERKFEVPYKQLLDAGVPFYASLGNHDAREQRDYKLFHMEGHLYYSFKAPRQKVRFFMLDTT